VSRLSRQCGILNISQPYRPPRLAEGIALLYFTEISICIYRTWIRRILIWIRHVIHDIEDNISGAWTQYIITFHISKAADSYKLFLRTIRNYFQYYFVSKLTDVSEYWIPYWLLVSIQHGISYYRRGIVLICLLFDDNVRTPLLCDYHSQETVKYGTNFRTIRSQ
jgi:hypothetical protein